MDTKEIIYAVGLWSLRLILATGLVIAAVMGKNDAVCLIALGLGATFTLL